MRKNDAGKFAIALMWLALLWAKWLAPACAAPRTVTSPVQDHACCAAHPVSCRCVGVAQMPLPCGGSCVCAPKSAPDSAPAIFHLQAEIPAVLPPGSLAAVALLALRASRIALALRRDSRRSRPVANAPPRAPPFLS